MSPHRFNFSKTLAYVEISKQFLRQAVASRGLKPSSAGLPLQNAPTTPTMIILGQGPQFYGQKNHVSQPKALQVESGWSDQPYIWLLDSGVKSDDQRVSFLYLNLGASSGNVVAKSEICFKIQENDEKPK